MQANLTRKLWILSIKLSSKNQRKSRASNKKFTKEPRRLMMSKRDWFHRVRLHMKETKSQCKSRRNTKFWKEWNKSMSKWLNFILRLKTINKWNWLKTKFKNWYESSPTCTQWWKLIFKRNKTNSEESTPIKYREE